MDCNNSIKLANSINKIELYERKTSTQQHIPRLFRKTQSIREMRPTNLSQRLTTIQNHKVPVRKVSKVASKILKDDDQVLLILGHGDHQSWSFSDKKSSLEQSFVEQFLQIANSKEKRKAFFDRLVQVSAGREDIGKVAKNIYKTLNRKDVAFETKLDFDDLLNEILASGLKAEQKTQDKDEVQGAFLRDSSLTVKLFQLHAIPKINKFFPDFDNVSLKALSYSSPRRLMRKLSEEKLIVHALDKVLETTWSLCKKGAFQEIRPSYSALYKICTELFPDNKRIGYEQAVGMFVFRTLCSHFFTTDYGEQRSKMVNMGKILNWTALEVDKDYSKIPDRFKFAFDGKSYENRKQIVHKIIQYLTTLS